jgi:hypothetical protein
MKHFASKSFNGSTITITKGDTLTVVLHYIAVRTEWSFGDNFGYNKSLDLGTMEVKDGVRTMEFTAHSSGTVEISLELSSVLGFPGPSNVLDTYKLTVTVL